MQRESSYTPDLSGISSTVRFVAVNTALQIGLDGAANAEKVGGVSYPAPAATRISPRGHRPGRVHVPPPPPISVHLSQLWNGLSDRGPIRYRVAKDVQSSDASGPLPPPRPSVSPS